MTLSIQSTNPALAALETLALQQGGQANAGSATMTGAAAGASSNSDSSAILSVSGGQAASSLDGISAIIGSASAADTAVSAGSVVETLLAQMRQDAQSASEPTLSSDDRAALNSGFQSDLAALSQTVAGASFGGVNLIDGSTASTGTNGATVNGVDMTPTGALIGLPANASLSDAAASSSLADQLGTAMDNVGQALGQIAAQGQAIATHLSVVAQANIAAQPSLASQVNGGLDADGASLAALQVQQQLSGSTGAIASQTPQAILALFR